MRTTHFMNKLLTFTHSQCYINNNSFNEYKERLMSQLGRVDLCGLKFVQSRGDLIAARGL
ncbi:hypothetical protein ADS77_05250 [Pseudoalteromonas porphyrae]|uniref:Uncharacterized protein n=1 Tax=Pseudoalteromonas porphyrae TaxID=187330 RepID=A0A0N1ELU3_9GAMM|nr:hypothetical protein ADS77_05250 [Pseudoalteromonas porphyrae]